jgi:hypothetical protein
MVQQRIFLHVPKIPKLKIMSQEDMDNRKSNIKCQNPKFKKKKYFDISTFAIHLTFEL